MSQGRIEDFIRRIEERDASRGAGQQQRREPIAEFCQLQTSILDEMRRLREEYRERAIVSESTLNVVRHL